MRCNALLLVCHGSDEGGVGRGRQGREGRELGLEKFYYVFFFFNIVLTWKIVGVSKTSVLYIYIDSYLSITFPNYF